MTNGDDPSRLYHSGSRRLQDRFDTRRLADRLESVKVRPEIDAGDRAFIESMDMFFLATADERGRPTCSYKGGDPGFVRVLDPRTIAFPNYDGNGMYLSWGNALVNPEVGLLFISFATGRRLRLNGTASIDERDPLLAEYPEAQFVVRVRAREVFPNCPRYIHRLELVRRSRFVPHAHNETPVPDWKRREWARDALPAGDPARAATGAEDGPPTPSDGRPGAPG
jgi:predicted pyridoxine 5'-phosphate oxidase superfamily flavin-nucleotide-binding protein